MRVSRAAAGKALESAGKAALIGLAVIYTRAAVQGDLWSNPNWTISNVMVYPYNVNILYFVLFPAFVAPRRMLKCPGSSCREVSWI